MSSALFLFLLSACPAGNLTFGKPAEGTGVRGVPGVVTDGALQPEGVRWDVPGAVILNQGDGQITVDLGEISAIRALVLQGDNNDWYHVQASSDALTWREIWAAPPHMQGEGLRTRFVQLQQAADARYLRVYATGGDNLYSISELRAYCQLPQPWPPALIIRAAESWWNPHTYWDWLGPPSDRDPGIIKNARMVGIKGVLALLGTILLGWGLVLRKNGQPDAHRKLRDRALAVLGALAFLSWWNLGHFHFENYLHVHEHYHYYMGSKYFRELGYTRLYMCSAIADAETGRTHRRLRNLVTNHLEPAESVTADPNECKSHFSEARWEQYKRDVVFFRSQFSNQRWMEAHEDHGYNATPVWGIAGWALSNLLPASRASIMFLGLLDSLLLCGMWVVIGWAFGWRTMCVALLYWGTNFPARYWWNGGAFLRMDWLVVSMIGICLVKRGRMAGGGFALTYGALLRIFPGFIVVGLILKALVRMVRERRWVLAPEHKRFAYGCITAMAVLIPLSAAIAGGGHLAGLDAWVGSGSGETQVEGFVQNSRKHIKTPLVNNMGLRTVLSYTETGRAIHLKNTRLEDPFDRWKAARLRVFEDRQILFFVLVAAFLVLLAWATERHEDWVALVLGVGLIPIAAELTCYYYSFMLAFGFLWAKRESQIVAVGLLFVSAVSCLVPGLFRWEDDGWVLSSAFFVLFCIAATAYMSRLPRAEGAEKQAAPPSGDEKKARRYQRTAGSSRAGAAK